MHEDYSRHGTWQTITEDQPLNVVPATADKAAAIRAFLAEFPNLGAGSAMDTLRRNGYPDLTLDEVRTVMAGRD